MVASEKKVVNARERLSQQNILDFFGEERNIRNTFSFSLQHTAGDQVPEQVS